MPFSSDNHNIARNAAGRDGFQYSRRVPRWALSASLLATSNDLIVWPHGITRDSPPAMASAHGRIQFEPSGTRDLWARQDRGAERRDGAARAKARRGGDHRRGGEAADSARGHG